MNRKRIVVNTDQQRRCYSGCNFSEELQWTSWDWIEKEVSEEKLEERMKFWVGLNDYAVSQRGEGARVEYRAEEELA